MALAIPSARPSRDRVLHRSWLGFKQAGNLRRSLGHVIQVAHVWSDSRRLGENSTLPVCSIYFLIIVMIRIDFPAVAQAILTAPGWARVGITASSEHLREDAALELAQSILADVSDEPALFIADQLQLGL
jgi:hypothetical protein